MGVTGRRGQDPDLCPQDGGGESEERGGPKKETRYAPRDIWFLRQTQTAGLGRRGRQRESERETERDRDGGRDRQTPRGREGERSADGDRVRAVGRRQGAGPPRSRHWSLHQLLRLEGRGPLGPLTSPPCSRGASCLSRSRPTPKQAPAPAHAPDGAPGAGLRAQSFGLRLASSGLYPLTSPRLFTHVCPNDFYHKTNTRSIRKARGFTPGASPYSAQFPERE